MSQFTVTVRVPQLAYTAASAARKRRALGQGAELIARAVREELTPHTRTGQTRASFTSRVVSDTTAIIGSNSPNAARLEYGTRPHEILPKVKRALAWPGEDVPLSAAGLGRGAQGTLKTGRGYEGFIVRKRVHHPGTRALRYIERAIAASRDLVATLFENIYR